MLFVTLPVADLDRSRRFYAALGLTARGYRDACLCLPVNATTMVILQPRERFAVMTAAPSAARGGREVLLTLSADCRSDVDTRADAALRAGGIRLHATQDHGTVYCRSVLDPDGHAWEIVWMDACPGATAGSGRQAGSAAGRNGRSPRSSHR